MIRVSDVHRYLRRLLAEERFVVDKTGVKTIELVGISFLADEPSIFGTPNEDYIKRELEWYRSMSLNVNDIPPPVPEIWRRVATPDGRINSNYGWCVWSSENGNQYDNALKELLANPDSRRAIMIYTRPSMHSEYNKDGMSDFMCTSTVQYLVRDGALHSVVNMRSNDAVFGYKNDLAWQKHVLADLACDLGLPVGDIIWQVGSLHVYERHFSLVRRES